jgi:hypothetical protein
MQTQTVSGVVQGVDASFNAMFPGILNYAESRIQRDLQLEQAVVLNTYTLSSGTNTLNIPVGDFIAVESATVNNVPILPASNEYIQNVYTSSGTQTGSPQVFCVQGGDTGTYGATSMILQFGPWADQNYTVSLRGLSMMPSLYTYANTSQAGSKTTFISTFLPDLLIQASMVYVAEFQRNFGATSNDPQMGFGYEQVYQELLRGASTNEARRRFESSGWTSHAPTTLATPGR